MSSKIFNWRIHILNYSFFQCSEDVLQCYYLRKYDANGKFLKAIHGCGDPNPTQNHHTCARVRKGECGRGSNCRCKQCYTRMCNNSPLFGSVAASTNTVVGVLDGIKNTLIILVRLVRIGTFDITLNIWESVKSYFKPADDFFSHY